MMAQPQFSEDIRQFEEYQRFLGAKYTDMLNALATADERARVEVRELLASKDATIQDLQSQLEKAKSSRETYEKFYHDSQTECDAAKKNWIMSGWFLRDCALKSGRRRSGTNPLFQTRTG